MNPLVIASLEKLLLAAIENGPALIQSAGSIASLAKGIVVNISQNNPDVTPLHEKIDALAEEFSEPLPPEDPDQQAMDLTGQGGLP